MKSAKNIIVYFLLVVCSLVLAGCGEKADETKPISEVKAEAEKMDTAKLRSMAMKYKEAVLAKKAEGAKLAEKLKEIPITELLGSEAKELKGEIENLNKSLAALRERFNVYYNKLKEKKGDLSGLEI
jgi:outer membrane murein-binding lipoprotein Lpp